MIQQVYISITQEDIDRGTRSDSCSCPVALALKRAVPVAVTVEVSETAVYFGDGVNRWFTSVIPLSAVRFIEDFDADRVVSPFDFMLTFFQKDSLQPALFSDFALT